jgi:hypothetical protein
MSLRLVRNAAIAAALLSSTAALADTLTSVAGYSAPNTNTSVLGINDAGYMTGTVLYLNPDGTSTGLGDAFIRAPDGTYTLFSAGTDFSQGRAIRNDNTIVGYTNPAFGTGLDSREFVRDPSGTVTQLTNPGTGAPLAGIAQGINASGAIVGNYRYLTPTNAQRNHGFILSGSTFTDISYPGHDNFQINARGITDDGTVVGFVGSTGEAFILQGGAMSFYRHPLDTGNGTVFEAITNSNMILGMYTSDDGNSHAFRFDAASGTFTDIIVPGATTVQAFGVNQTGQFALTSDIGNFIYSFGGPTAPDGSTVFLPVDDGAGPSAIANFNFGVVAGQTYYIDPSFARGFEYLSGSNVDFASVTLPVGVAPGDTFTLALWDGTGYHYAGTIQAGVQYDFAGPVDRFRIYGIPAGAGIDANSPSGFITGLTFDGNGQFNGQQISLVPEPAEWALMIGGFGLAGLAARRRKGRFATA